MEFKWLILSFLGLMIVSCSVVIYILRRALISNVDGAVKRLNAEIEETQKKQADLSQKMRAADEELTKRQTEARELAEKMRSSVEEESKTEREKIISAARTEGELIIEKAQNAKVKMKEELEKEFDTKVVHYSMEILNAILSEKLKGAFDKILIEDFTQRLKDVDMGKISPDVKEAEVITVTTIDETQKNTMQKLITDTVGRPITLKNTLDEKIVGGVVLKFGSTSLDGSLKNMIRDEGVRLHNKVEARK